jgi:hypothetical protein
MTHRRGWMREVVSGLMGLDEPEATRATELDGAHQFPPPSVSTGTSLRVALETTSPPDKQGTVAMRPARRQRDMPNTDLKCASSSCFCAKLS